MGNHSESIVRGNQIDILNPHGNRPLRRAGNTKMVRNSITVFLANDKPTLWFAAVKLFSFASE